MNKVFVTNWKSQLKKGTLSFIVMNILHKKTMYGYELIENIKDYSSIVIAEGTLYPLLNRLKNEKLVTSEWVEQPHGIPRKYYSLTSIGIKTLIAMREYWQEVELSINKIS